MKRLFQSVFLALGLISLGSFIGCNGGGGTSVDSQSETSEVGDHDHDHDHDHGDHDHGDHDHGDHDEHDHAAHEHPAHGQNGGHMVKLDDGTEIEVALSKEDDSFAIFPADAAAVTSIKMISKVEADETTYDFKASEAADLEGAFVLTSPELATAVRMGEAVEVTLVVETEAGSASTRYEHHEH